MLKLSVLRAIARICAMTDMCEPLNLPARYLPKARLARKQCLVMIQFGTRSVSSSKIGQHDARKGMVYCQASVTTNIISDRLRMTEH